MKKYITIIIILFPICLLGQMLDDTIGLPFVTNYSSRIYHANNQTWGIAQDKAGVMYFANDGVLIFDGSQWHTIQMPFHATVRSITVSDFNKVYLCGDDFLGYLGLDSVGSLKYISLLDKLPEKYRDRKNYFRNIKVKDDIIYVKMFDGLLMIKADTYEVIDAKKCSYYISSDNTLYIYGSDQIKIIKQNTTDSIPFDKYIVNFFEKNDTIIAFANDSKFYYFNEDNKPVFYHKLNLPSLLLSEIKQYNNDYLLLSTLDRGSFFADFYGNPDFNFYKRTGLISNVVYSSFLDNRGNLWFATNKGISFVEYNSPLRIVDSRFNFGGGRSLFLGRFDNNLYTNIDNLLYKISFGRYLDTKIEEIETQKYQMWSGIEVGDEFYISSRKQILRLDKADNIKYYGPNDNIWQILKVPETKNDYLIGTLKNIYHYRYDGDSLKYYKILNETPINAREMIFEDKNTLWISGENKAIVKYDISDSMTFVSSKNYGKSEGITFSNSVDFHKWNNLLLLASSNGLYYYDAKTDLIKKFDKINKNLPFEAKKSVRLVNIDSNDIFLFKYIDEEFNSNLFCLKYNQATKEFEEILPTIKRLFNFYPSHVLNYNDSLTIYSTDNGLVLHNINKRLNKNFPTNLYINKITAGDTNSTIFGGHYFNERGEIISGVPEDYSVTIPHQTNIEIECIVTPAYIVAEQTKYRVKLVGVDSKWSNWSYENIITYNNLSVGRYVFMVQAKDIYGVYTNISKFNIIVKPPWFMTTIAYIIYFLLVICVIYYINKFFTIRLRKQKERLEQIVKSRTNEILENNEKLQLQKEEIMIQAEKLQLANHELEKLSVIARETGNSIILTDEKGDFVWVNQAFTNISGYTIEELRETFEPDKLNILHSKSDEKVKQIIRKCFKEKITVEYDLKLYDKFNKPFWIHSTLTPLLDSERQITSFVAIDADITQLKTVEKQIIEQRDAINASIRYANNIQQSILPLRSQIDNFFDNFIIFKPKDIVSGDFYWLSNLFYTDNGILRRVLNEPQGMQLGQTLFFTVVDCTGHGVPGAFMSLIGSRLLSEIINEKKTQSPKDILYNLDSRLKDVLRHGNKISDDGMTISLCRLDMVTNDIVGRIKVTFAGAKQHLTIFESKTRSFKRYKGSIRQIGFNLNKKLNFCEQVFLLDKDDVLFFASDGLKDLNNPDRESFSYHRIVVELGKIIDLPTKVIGENFNEIINNWLADGSQRDDITFIGLKII